MRSKAYFYIFLSIFVLFLSTISISASTNHQEKDNSTIPTHKTASYISNNILTVVKQDHFGRIWIGTNMGLNRYDGKNFYQYFSSDSENSIQDNEIKDLFVDSKGRLWVSTPFGISYLKEDDTFQRVPNDGKSNQNGIYAENPDGKIALTTDWELMEYLEEENFFKTRRSFPTQGRYYLYSDKNGFFWLIYGSILEKLDPNTFETVFTFNLGFIVNSACKMSNGLLLISGEHKIISYDTTTHSASNPFSEEFNSILAKSNIGYIEPYENSTVLIGFSDAEYVLYDLLQKTLLKASDGSFPIEVPNSFSNTFFVDKDKNVWFCTRMKGLFVSYSQSGLFGSHKNISNFFKGTSILSLAKDKSGRFLVSSDKGTYFYEPRTDQLSQCVIKTNSEIVTNNTNTLSAGHFNYDGDLWASNGVQLFRFKVEDNILTIKKSYAHGGILCVTNDDFGNIWAGTYNGLVLHINNETGEETILDPYPGDERFIAAALINYNGKIVVGAYPYNLRAIDPITFKAEDLIDDKLFTSKIKGLYIPTTLYADRFGKLWIGSNSNGALCYDSENKTLEKIEGTSSSNIFSFCEDSYGNIWMGSVQGLNKYNLNTKRITSYFEDDGISSNQFNDRMVNKMNDGTIVFGTFNGITLVNPIKDENQEPIKVYFEDLKIYNNLVNPSDNGTISKSLIFSPKVTINPKDKNFSISFSALDYSENRKSHFMYKMEGFDKEWIDAGNNDMANYSNMGPGKYTFLVKVATNNENIEEEVSSLSIKIKTPIWASWWALLTYFLLISGIFTFIVSSTNQVRKAKQESIQAKYEKEQEILLNKRNKSFFANVAHEFRTPLTMISGPVTILNDSSRIQGRDRNMLMVIRQNVNRMLELVNQFMDFNKLENDTLRLFVSKSDIVEFLKNYLLIFTTHAEQKALNFESHFMERRYMMYFDSDKIMKIMSNLVSNAFKFTPSGGDIFVSFEVISNEDVRKEFTLGDNDSSKAYAKITVSDSGPGIPEEQFQNIFKQYYQLDTDKKEVVNIGTGIGLYYAKSLVEMHHGFIKVSNRTTGTGSVFCFIIPTDDDAYTEKEKTSDDDDQTKIYPIGRIGDFSEEGINVIEEAKATEKAPRIYVVDDDIDVANYLKLLLKTDFNVSTFYDADSALKAIRKTPPAMVLSDVIMPEKSGYELCEEIKKDPKISDTSIILLTAHSSVEGQIKSLGIGADAYVSKPFDPIYLMTLIKTTLSKNESIKKQRSSLLANVDPQGISPSDNALLKDIYDMMEKELDNPNFDIDSILEKISMSRSKFYYKIKELTGETPNDLLKKYRLKKAEELLKEGHHTIAEISEMTGFSTCSYFSVVFKKQYGVSPSEYKQSEREA